MCLGSSLVIAIIACIGASAPPKHTNIKLHRNHMYQWESFLDLGSSDAAMTSTAAARRSYFRAVHNNTHAIEYSGQLQIGGQDFTMIFDTGSDRIIVPSVDCISAACKKHRFYDSSQSRNVVNMSNPAPAQVSYGMGNALGYEAEDRVCLGDACAEAGFVQVLEESDQTFLDADFDGVVGLSLQLRSTGTRKQSFLNALFDAGAIPHMQFSVYMAADLVSDTSEISFGVSDPSRALSPVLWTGLSEPGYWQISLADLSVGGQRLELCGKRQNSSTLRIPNGTKVSSFFGKMCCRTVAEFEHEDRCQFNASWTGWRSHTMDSGVVLAQYPDGRIAVKMQDGCVQKVPRTWITLPNGCRGDGTIQAVLDTGSSLIMGPRPLVDSVLKTVGVKENCTNQDRTTLPNVSLALQNDKHILTLLPEDYMDIVSMSDGVYCWPHFLAAPETGKGPALILGMPFLRAFYTTFDAANQRVGFARAVPIPNPHKQRGKIRSTALRGRRPRSFDDNLIAALREEHWTG